MRKPAVVRLKSPIITTIKLECTKRSNEKDSHEKRPCITGSHGDAGACQVVVVRETSNRVRTQKNRRPRSTLMAELKPQAVAIPKEFKNLEMGRYGPIWPKTPACHGFTLIAKVKPGK